MTPHYDRNGITLYHGDCRDVLASLAAAAFDSVVCDPPYPCIKRPYGTWTEPEWFDLMEPVVEQCRRLLKPTGSAVFVLQPNSERVGKMRMWLWEFVLKWGKAWGLVQDAYWWNITAQPTVHSNRTRGLLRPSLKMCVWLGAPDCYRNQDAVLWQASDRVTTDRLSDRALRRSASGAHNRDGRMIAAAIERGGTTPFNVLPVPAGTESGKWGHGAGTPLALTRWWVRYITPPGGLVLDPFAGSGTTLLAARTEGIRAVGIEQDASYCDMAVARVGDTKPLPGERQAG